MKKGQFMILSAFIASLITISLSTTITNIQSDEYNPQELPKDINQIKAEIEKITRDNTITDKEERNFRKMLNYYKSYETEAEFDKTKPCIEVTLENSDKTVEMQCIS